MTNIKNIALGAAIALSLGQSVTAATITMNTPTNFYVNAVSPNGKWACGYFLDLGANSFGFRWNLESGKVEMLSSAEISMAYDIADDGTVSGEFSDREVYSNGAPISTAGIYRGGHWNHLEMPKGKLGEGIGGCISPDGKYMAGAIEINKRYTPVVWENGAIRRVIDTGSDAVALAISPDGKSAAGFNTLKNRAVTIWTEGKEPIYLLDSPELSYSPWNYARNFSPDGLKLLYWGGFDTNEDKTVNYLYAIYDMVSGERTKVEIPSGESNDIEFNEISNTGLIVGNYLRKGYLYDSEAGKGYIIDDYLTDRGIDLSNYPDFYSGEEGYQGELPIYNVVGTSADGNTLVCRYYNKEGLTASLAIHLDRDASLMAPAEVKASQLSGISTVGVTWEAPVGAVGIRGYNIYRDGKKLNGVLPLNALSYYDKNLASGTYTYTVAAVNASGKETAAEEISVEVTAESASSPLAVFSRQKGINSALLTWLTPMSNQPHLYYYNPNSNEYNGFNVYESIEVETAVRYDRNMLACYGGYSINEVSFRPVNEHYGWNINIYTRNGNDLELIATQPVTQKLTYNTRNTVKLDSPVAIPSTGDLYVAVACNVNSDHTGVIAAEDCVYVAGYSDLLRQTSEPDFYSAFDRSLASGAAASCLSWCIDLTLENPEAAAPSNVEKYVVYANGKKVTETTETSVVIPALADGRYEMGVEAVYADGTASSAATATVKIAGAYKGVENVNVTHGEGNSYNFSWEAPLDNDAFRITYTSDEKVTGGVRGSEDNGWAMMVSAEYPATMMKSYEGYKVKTIDFYPLCDAIYTLYLFENGKQILMYEVPEFTEGEWNCVELPEEIVIKAGASYQVVVDAFDPEPNVNVIAIDNNPAVSYYSDLYSLDNGLTWKSYSYETSRDGNFMLGMGLEAPDAQAAAVDGFNLYIDSNKCNAEMLSTTEYTHEFATTDDKQHTVRVDTYYPARAEAVKGGDTKFYLTVGVESNLVAKITLHCGMNTLVAEGENISSIAIYTTSGVMVAETASAEINITDLSEGIYIVRVNSAAGQFTQKISISK